jgi:hypothetical protein
LGVRRRGSKTRVKKGGRRGREKKKWVKKEGRRGRGKGREKSPSHFWGFAYICFISI